MPCSSPSQPSPVEWCTKTSLTGDAGGLGLSPPRGTAAAVGARVAVGAALRVAVRVGKAGFAGVAVGAVVGAAAGLTGVTPGVAASPVGDGPACVAFPPKRGYGVPTPKRGYGVPIVGSDVGPKVPQQAVQVVPRRSLHQTGVDRRATCLHVIVAITAPGRRHKARIGVQIPLAQGLDVLGRVRSSAMLNHNLALSKPEQVM